MTVQQKKISDDADLLPVLLEAYEEAKLETRRLLSIGELIQRLEEQTGETWVREPHHNGMIQLSNELADAKAALRRLSTYARTYAGDIQYTGDHPIAVAEKLAGRELCGNAEQLDTAPAQFEALAGEPVSKPYKLPIEMTPEMMRAVQLNSELGAYATANLAGAYDLFAEFWEVACRNSPAILDGWVACSERMPEDRESVLLWDIDLDDACSGHYSHETGNFYQAGMIIDNEITHWMLLPAAPQQEVK